MIKGVTEHLSDPSDADALLALDRFARAQAALEQLLEFLDDNGLVSSTGIRSGFAELPAVAAASLDALRDLEPYLAAAK
jgi:hypothetical protein